MKKFDMLIAVIIVIACILSLLLGLFFNSFGLDRKILGDKVIDALLHRSDWTAITILTFRRLVLLFGIGLIGIYAISAVWKRDVSILVICLFISFQINSFIGFTIPVYVDSIGLTNALNLTSFILLLAFVVLIQKDLEWVHRILASPIFWCFFVIILCGLATQIYYLGFIKGLGIVYIRVVQPLIFITLISYVAASKRGMQKIITSIVLVIMLGILLYYISPQKEITNPALNRVSILGSWTIYGTLLAASLPLAISLWVMNHDLKLRMFLAIAVPVIFLEVIKTQTRGAIFALGTLSLFLLSRRIRQYPFVIGLTGVIFFYLLFNPIPEMKLSGDRLLSFNIEKIQNDSNWQSRMARNAKAITYLSSHPFSGIGLGQPTPGVDSELPFWVYNTYLHWGVAFGLPAMLAFCGLMLYSIFHAIKNIIYETEEFKIYQMGFFIALLVWIINQFTTADSLSYLSSVEATLMFYAVIGMILGQNFGLKESTLVNLNQYR